jgi:hypothetical protein
MSEDKLCTKDSCCSVGKIFDPRELPGVSTCRRFETGGVPGPTSAMSPRAPAQMGRREAEREGGK